MSEVYYQWAVNDINDLEAFEIKLLESPHITKDLNGDTSNSSYFGNAIDALLYNPVYDTGAWSPYKFPQRSLDYLQIKIYENNPAYALFISNSFIDSSYIQNLDIALSNDKSKIFSVGDRNGLRLIDISDLYNPVITNLLSGYMELITISSDNKRLYIKSNGMEEYFLKIIDISDILNPVEISQTSVPNFSNMQLSKDETKLYVTFSDYDNGIKAIDISDITQPIISSGINTVGIATNLILSEDEQTAYMTDARGGLQIIDISNSNDFKLLGTYITNGLVEKVILSNDKTKAYLTVKYPIFDDLQSTEEGHVNVVDITDKSNPALLTEFDLNCSPLTALIFNSDETKMFVSSSQSNGYTFDYNDKIYENIGYFQEMSLLGETSKSYYTSSDKLMLMESETIMLAVSYYKIDIIDISDPTNPTIIKTIQLNSPPG